MYARYKTFLLWLTWCVWVQIPERLQCTPNIIPLHVSLTWCVWVQIPERLQCTPHLNSGGHPGMPHIHMRKPGVYRGFCLRGKPHGRGQWVEQENRRLGPRSTYSGDWQQGVAHGMGVQVICNDGYRLRMLWGEFRNGFWQRYVLSRTEWEAR